MSTFKFHGVRNLTACTGLTRMSWRTPLQEGKFDTTARKFLRKCTQVGKKRHFKACRLSSILLANNRLTCVDLGWVAERWKTCVNLRANLISTNVSASQRKCTQALAKRSLKLTQVFSLRQLASPFGQGFKHYFVKLKPGNKFKPDWDLNPWTLRYRCSALPTEVSCSSQLGWAS